jgi:hypothetical protein
MTLENALRITSATRNQEGITTLIDEIFKLSQETTPPRTLNQLQDIARGLGLDIRIKRRRRAVTFSRRNPSCEASSRGWR